MRRVAAEPALRGLLVLALSAAGCPAKSPPAPLEPSAPEPSEPSEPAASACAEGGPLFASAAELNPSRPVDGVALRVRRDRVVGEDGARATLASTGPLCEEAACAPADEAAWSGPSLRTTCYQMGCDVHHLAVREGDSVAAIGDADALIAFLGPIDTAAEARLLAWARGFEPTCEVAAEGDGFTVRVTHHVSDCPIQDDDVTLRIGADGAIAELARIPGPTGACIGRLPPGLADAPAGATRAGEWLAEAARLEAAAVLAFDGLVAELVHHGAPEALIDAARHAAADEARHAALVGALARARGVEPAPVHAPVGPPRALEAIALDNAVEGLARESWGALVGLWQARRAADAEVRAVMTWVARDEVSHAELSRALHAWLATRLDAAALARVEAARVAMWGRLRASALAPCEPALAAALGLPVGEDARALFDAAAAAGLAA